MVVNLHPLYISFPNMYLFQQVCGQHQNLRIRPEALDSAQVSDSFLGVFRGRHDFEDIERSP